MFKFRKIAPKMSRVHNVPPEYNENEKGGSMAKAMAANIAKNKSARICLLACLAAAIPIGLLLILLGIQPSFGPNAGNKNAANLSTDKQFEFATNLNSSANSSGDSASPPSTSINELFNECKKRYFEHKNKSHPQSFVCVCNAEVGIFLFYFFGIKTSLK